MMLITRKTSNSSTRAGEHSLRLSRAPHASSLTLPGFATEGIVSERHSGFKDTAELHFGEAIPFSTESHAPNSTA